MRFESHRLHTKPFVVHESRKMRLNTACCYFMNHKRVRRITCLRAITHRQVRCNRRIHNELRPACYKQVVAEKFKEFLETGEVTP